MNIVLIGYMTSGKTSVGKIIQDQTDYKWVDLDLEIENKEKKSISQIFNEKGDLYFRKIERNVMLEILKNDNQIISLGGGTPCYYNNIEEINNHAISFYLKASVDSLIERIVRFKDERPLVKNRTEEELKEFVAKHLFERNFYYYKANYTIETDNKSFYEIADEIINKTTNKLQ